MSITLDSIRRCFEGAVPATIATCASDGTPNVALLSQVHYVDNQHVALSFQFFNKTRENILSNPYATVMVVDPDTAVHYRLKLKYLHTETSGPLFEYMKAKLAGIASHTGMSKVFRLLGSDIYEVIDLEQLPGINKITPKPQRSRLAALLQCTRALSQCTDLDNLLEVLMQCLQHQFDVHHAMVLMHDSANQRLYTVASIGYSQSGVGSEIPVGTGLIGVVAKERTPIRIMHLSNDYVYSLAMRESLRSSGVTSDIETEIPFPGLTSPGSQLAVPICHIDKLLGVLYVESDRDMRFSFEDEDALSVMANQLATAIYLERLRNDMDEEKPETLATPQMPDGTPIQVRYYPINQSIFIDDEYLIKGVAGAILRKLLRDWFDHKRSEFTNRQLRLDPTLKLPEFGDNLEARLVLLQKRLAERCDFMQLQKTGRGRFRLTITRPLQLTESPN